jgi:hypothetical protein
MTNKDLEKIIYAGLFYDPNSDELRERGIKLEDVPKKIIPQFYALGNGYEDLIACVMKALGDAKIIDARPYFRTQRRLDIMNEDRLADILMKNPVSEEEKDEIITILRGIYFGKIPELELAQEMEGAGDEEEGNEN